MRAIWSKKNVHPKNIQNILYWGVPLLLVDISDFVVFFAGVRILSGIYADDSMKFIHM